MKYKTKSSISEKETIIREIHESPNIIDWSIGEIIHIEKSSKSIIKYLYDSQERLIGVYVIKKINSKTLEIALVLVLKKFQGLGYGKKLLEECIKNCAPGSIVYTASRNTIVKKFLKEKDFKEIPLLAIPRDIIFYLIKNKIKLHKIIPIFKKAFLPGWKYYIKKL